MPDNGLTARGLGTIAVGPDQTDLRDAVRTFCRRHVTEDVVREAIEAEREQMPEWWPQVAEQGLLGLHLPESCGGAGHGFTELAIAIEEFGRFLTPGPFVPTVLAAAVLHAGGHTTLLPYLTDGTATAAVDLSGTRTGLVGVRTDTGLSVSGTTQPVIGGHLADHFVLPVRVEDGTYWVLAPRSDVEVADRTSHDLLRRLATLRLDDLVVGSAEILDLSPERPREIGAVLFAAEACGVADRVTSVAADYACTREQFGRPVGQFQGVKHRLARMFVRTEQGRACVWDAARALDSTSPDAEVSLAVAVAATTTIPGAFAVAKDAILTLGGIGFTWEHLAGFALRRVQTTSILLGPDSDWSQRVATLSLGGARRPLSLELPPEAATIRLGIAAELDPLADLDVKAARVALAERGYTAPHFAAPWGKGADAVTQLVIEEELAARSLTPHNMIIGNWAVPTLIAHGSDDLQQRLVPASLRGDVEWCQMFSEPGAGSDLAALSTRAEKVDGGWRVNGQKVWTSGAMTADYAILLARTDGDVARHKGLSYFVLDMAAPGIDIRPLRELTGGSYFSEVFLDDVFIPDEMLVGEPGSGWKLAITTLANERVHMTSNSSTGTAELLFEHVDAEDPCQLVTLGKLLADAQSGGLLGLRQTIRSIAGLQPGAESSVAKLVGAENVQATWETLMDFWGGASLITDPDDLTATWWFLNSRALTIAGGTTDIQLNIIGERILGLPRDPAPTRK